MLQERSFEAELWWQRTAGGTEGSNLAKLSWFSLMQPPCVWLELMRISGYGTWERQCDPACWAGYVTPVSPTPSAQESCSALP